MNNLQAAHAEIAADLPQEAAPLPPEGAVMVGGRPHLADPKGRLVPLDMVRPLDLLIDEEVRKIVRFARALSAQVARFKQHTLDDISGVKALVAQEYGASLGGEKGNLTLTSFDGLMKVSLKIADVVSYGPELQAAKAKVTECIRNWQGGADPKLVALVETAFQVDQEGQVNRSNLLYLLRLQIDDPTWTEGMKAIRESERPSGTKEYVQIHVRPQPGAKWEHVTIDLAAA
jgi:hypothetical protein